MTVTIGLPLKSLSIFPSSFRKSQMKISDLIHVDGNNTTPSSNSLPSRRRRAQSGKQEHVVSTAGSSAKLPAHTASESSSSSSTLQHAQGLVYTNLNNNNDDDDSSNNNNNNNNNNYYYYYYYNRFFHPFEAAGTDYSFHHQNSLTTPHSSATYFDSNLNPSNSTSFRLGSALFFEPKVENTFFRPDMFSDPNVAGPSNVKFPHPQVARRLLAPDAPKGFYFYRPPAFDIHTKDDSTSSTQNAPAKLEDIPYDPKTERNMHIENPSTNDHRSYPTITSSPHINTRDQKVHVCSHCGKSFKRPFVLRKHIECVHLNVRPFACDMCNKTFTQKQTLVVHQKIVHLKEKLHPCHLCDKNFAQKGDMERHIRAIHTKERPFACSECDLKFGLHYQLVNHAKLVHHRSSEFKCHYCGRYFRNSETLENHIQGLHQRKK